MAGHRHHLAVGVESAQARANSDGAAERRHTTRQVHHARARKVDAAAEDRLVLVLGEGAREEAVVAPDPVNDDGVDEAGEHGGVDEVCLEGAALGDGTGDDGGSGGREDILEEPERHRCAVVLRVLSSPADRQEGPTVVRGRSDECVPVAVARVAVGDAKAPGPPDDGTDAGVQQVLEQDVLGVLGAHRSRLEQREAALHEEDKHAAHEEVEGVQRLRICPQRGRL
mmetsp:Transcript_6907/g.19725  ORF Transcript_6907/g.19725 Transcript_6907/m.19725 type:complete len:226 (+) Transcript_6907:1048-1725(+)